MGRHDGDAGKLKGVWYLMKIFDKAAVHCCWYEVIEYSIVPRVRIYDTASENQAVVLSVQKAFHENINCDAVFCFCGRVS